MRQRAAGEPSVGQATCLLVGTVRFVIWAFDSVVWHSSKCVLFSNYFSLCFKQYRGTVCLRLVHACSLLHIAHIILRTAAKLIRTTNSLEKWMVGNI